MKKSLLAILGLSANLFLIGCADDQARQQIADTNQRLNQIQQNVGVLDNKVSNQKVLDLLNQVSDLQSQINQLNGRITTLEQGQSSGQGDIGQQLQALDLRVQALESGISSGHSSRNTVRTPTNNKPSTLTPELQDAIKKIQGNETEQAINELHQIINSGDKASASQARYFLSVAYLASNQAKSAITEANKFIADNGNSKYVPDALRLVYIAQSQLGNNVAAKQTAKKLIKSFPNSEAAKKVAKQLQN
ncbi:MAG: hypothetical protein RLZZ293_1481 [Pseudomonadota bacterium]|jgi:TolA-binding protein